MTVKHFRMDKLIKSFVALSCSISMVVPMSTYVKAENNVTADVFPKPHSLEMTSNEGMLLEGEVNLVVHGNQLTNTLNIVKQELQKNDIRFSEGTEVEGNKANIIICSEGKNCAACQSEDSSLEQSQGYVLSINNDENAKGEVKIVGTDETGAYYGVQTLAQLFDQNTDGYLPKVTVSDYPEIKTRGVIEGFYGYPWSHNTRLKMIKDLGNAKMNMYIYGPKDDEYHRTKWREPYPADKLNEFKELAEAGKAANVDFCWTIHPANGFNFDDPASYEAITNKLEQLYSVGVRRFGVFFDDITVRGSDNDDTLGGGHARIINHIEDWIASKGDVGPIVTVPTIYNNGARFSVISFEGYLKYIFEAVDEDGIILWTGRSIFSEIKKSYFEEPKTRTGVDRNLAAWWNHPVNDVKGDGGNLYVGEFENGVEKGVDNLTGFFLNPMPQGEASKVAILSGADYAWNSVDFDSHESWKAAIKRLAPDCSEAFERFADNIGGKRSQLPRISESKYLKPKINNYYAALRNQVGYVPAVEDLKSEFEQMLEDVFVLREMENKEMAKDCETHLNAYEALARSGISSMDMLLAIENKNDAEFIKNYYIAKAYIDYYKTFTIKSLLMNGNGAVVVDTAKVGAIEIYPFVYNLIRGKESLFNTKVFGSKENKFVSNKEDLSQTIQLSGTTYSSDEISTVLNKGDYIGISFADAIRFSELSLTNVSDNLTLQISLNGREWIEIEAAWNENELVYNTNLHDIAYLRLVNTSEEAVTLEQSVLTVDLYQDQIIRNMELKPSKAVMVGKKEYMIDNDLTTNAYLSSSDTSLLIDLHKNVNLDNIKIYYNYNSGFQTEIQISSDNQNWESIGLVNNNAIQEGYNFDIVDFTNIDKKNVRYIKVNYVNAAYSQKKIYEIKINDGIDYSNEPVEYPELIDADFELIDENYAYDSNLNTALTSSLSNGTFTYQLSTIRFVDQLIIPQGIENISHANVEVLTPKGQWKSIGTLDEIFNVFDIKEQILEVRITFAGEVTPKIYEVIPTRLEGIADYAKVEEAIARANALDRDHYVDFSAVDKALNAVVKELDITKQEEVDAMAQAILDAIDALEYKDANEIIYSIYVKDEIFTTGTYNTKVTLTTEPEGFIGWKVEDVIVSTDPTYTFYISNDMYFEPCYEETAVIHPQAILTNTTLTKRDTKADIKFTAQLVVPTGYTIKNAGLVWSSKEGSELSLENTNLKPTYITRISNTDQFSVTIKGMPAGKFIRGKIFATLVDSEGNESIVYSEEARAINK